MTIEWFVPVARSGCILEALHTLMIAGRAESGCMGCSVTTDVVDRAVIRYVEQWRSEADLQRQFQSDRFARLISLVESGEEPPFVEFDVPAGIRGLDYITEASGRPYH